MVTRQKTKLTDKNVYIEKEEGEWSRAVFWTANADVRTFIDLIKVDESFDAGCDCEVLIDDTLIRTSVSRVDELINEYGQPITFLAVRDSSEVFEAIWENQDGANEFALLFYDVRELQSEFLKTKIAMFFSESTGSTEEVNPEELVQLAME